MDIRCDENLPLQPRPQPLRPYTHTCECGKRAEARLGDGTWLCAPCFDAEADECVGCEIPYFRSGLKFTRSGDGPLCADCQPDEEDTNDSE